MHFLRSESFEREIDDNVYLIVDPGPIHGPVRSFKMRRDEDLKLVLETTAEAGDAPLTRGDVPPNTVKMPSGEIHVQHRYTPTIDLKLRGITLRQQSEDWPSGVVRQICTIQTLEWVSGVPEEPGFVVEWVENLSGRRFHWPDLQTTKEVTSQECTFNAQGGTISVQSSHEGGNSSLACARLNIVGTEVILSELPWAGERKDTRGILIFLGTPDRELRRRVRDCIAYSLGQQLLLLSSATFSRDWKLLECQSVSCSIPIEQARRASGRPPAPLDNCVEHRLDPKCLEQRVSALVACYESLRLGTAFWNYWHAIVAPVHMAAVHYGAAIEAIQQSYKGASENQRLSTSVCDDREWKKILPALQDCIDKADLSDYKRCMLSRKLSGLNRAPQAELAQRFFQSIDLDLSPLEKKVWQNRNRAAHGAGVAPEDSVKTIRENKVLLTMLNRIILAVSRGADCYYDYYTLERPVRSLHMPVPESREDGSQQDH